MNGSQLPLELCLQQEHRLATRLLDSPDFAIGVQTVLVDRVVDAAPKWKSTDHDATPERIAAYFAPLDDPEMEFTPEFPTYKEKSYI